MPEFGERSLKNLKECHEDIQSILNEVIKTYDCSVIEGYRGKEEQNKAYDEGKSKLKYPQSKHNQQPSLAVDVVPYPIDWDNTKQFYHFAGYVQGVADQLGIELRWGGDWNRNFEVDDNKFDDFPHFELKG